MDLSTKYLGIDLKNPIVPSAGPLSADIGNIKAMEDAGAAAIVLHSLFEEQIESEELELHAHTTEHNEQFPEAVNYFPEPVDYKKGPEEYLEHVKKAKDAVEIPIIASLNGYSAGGWTDYAKKLQEAGADALELNVYILATDVETPGATIEDEYVKIVKAVKGAVSIPVAVKLSPFFSSVANLAKRLEDAGADGLTLFNRFYQPDIDLENLEVIPNVLLSTPMALRLPLRWIGILYKRVNVDFAATSGVYSEKDALKTIMAGANVAQVLSCLLKYGIGHITDVVNKMKNWMEINEYKSLDQMRGSMSYMNVPDPSRFERANYAKVIGSIK
jgi:dihydroorotate dehydrogenase (fumarate)